MKSSFQTPVAATPKPAANVPPTSSTQRKKITDVPPTSGTQNRKITDAAPTSTARRKKSPDVPPTSGAQKKKGLRPWVWVWVAFALQIVAWIFWIKVASQHRVEEVPLATAPTHGPPAAQNSAREGTETLNRDVSLTSDTRN